MSCPQISMPRPGHLCTIIVNGNGEYDVPGGQEADPSLGPNAAANSCGSFTLRLQRGSQDSASLWKDFEHQVAVLCFSPSSL